MTESAAEDFAVKAVEPEKLIDQLLDRAGGSGAAEYEVYVVKGRSLAIAAKERRIDQLRYNLELAACVRLIDQGRLGFAYTTDFTPEALDRTVRLAAAGIGLSDRLEELALPQAPSGPYPEVEVSDPELRTTTQEEKMEMVLLMEAAALDLDHRIERVRQAEYRESEYAVWLANNHGLSHHHSGTVVSGSLMAKAADGDQAEVGYEVDSARFLKKLDLEAIGRAAAERAVQGLGGRKVATRRGPVILENRVTAEFLSILSASFLADNVQKGKSTLKGRLGQKIMSPRIHLTDDGLYPFGLATAPADAEGVPKQTTSLVKAGVLESFLYDTPRARKDRTVSTGNAGRGGVKSPPGVAASNLILAPGDASSEELAADLGEGLWVTEIMGAHTANHISGDFSVGVSGQWIKNGQPQHPVKGMALAGNVLGMFDAVARIGSDLRLFGSLGAPSLLIEELILSGQ